MNYTTNEILDALNNNEIIAWFQPQYNANTGIMVGAEADFIPKLTRLISEYNVQKEKLHIEITETAMYISSEDVKEWAWAIHNAGFILAIDDFGSGMSSIGVISEIPADIIKFDKSLFENINDNKTRVILDALFYCANRLNVTTIAEGIETNEQLKLVQTCDCKYIQGFLFDAPMSKDDFVYLALGYLDRYEELLENSEPIMTYTSVGHLLLQALYKEYPLIILGNLSKNSYYMIAHEDFTSKQCKAAGTFDELIETGFSTMHPDSKEEFANRFSRKNLLEAHKRGEDGITMIAKQLGDDGIYRDVKITDYFVSNPTRKDIMIISFNQNV